MHRFQKEALKLALDLALPTKRQGSFRPVARHKVKADPSSRIEWWLLAAVLLFILLANILGRH